METKNYLGTLLKQNNFFPVIEFPPDRKIIWLDLTSQNTLLASSNFIDTQQFEDLIFNQLLNENIGVGGYQENRIIYQRSTHYQGAEPRSVHLGMDIWMPAATPVHTPLSAVVHSFQDNQGFGNYGPTIILEHQITAIHFYTLYGHLSRRSLQHLKVGKAFTAGDLIGHIGPYPENGDWPPHLHFQVMTSMEGYVGDFPGVAAPSQAAEYLKICLDPNLILQLSS